MIRGEAYDPLKRLVDVCVAIVGIVITAPLQVVVAALVRLKLGRPVLFRQERPGKDEQIFELVKFRTMLETDQARGLVSDADRLTPLGAFLRSTSLDELPTLWNVLRGDMSLVGPRPLLRQYVDLYSPQEKRRHHVRPGITGLAQVSGRNALAWEERFARDLEYVDRRSLALDLKLILRTARMVFHREGITDGSTVTMTEYGGHSTQTDSPQGRADRTQTLTTPEDSE